MGVSGENSVRATLISALVEIAADRQREIAFRFLQGLSADELQYIAEFVGTMVLECSEGSESRAQLAERIAAFLRAKRSRQYSQAASLTDQDHKVILLMEYLGRSGLDAPPRVMRAG